MAKFDNSNLEIVKTTDDVLTINYKDKDAFMHDCPVDKKVVIDVYKHQHEFIKEATEYATNVSIEEFNKDKDIQKIYIDFPYGPTGAGSYSVAATREKTFKIPGTDKVLTRPDITGKVSDGKMKAGKKFINDLQDKMLEALK